MKKLVEIDEAKAVKKFLTTCSMNTTNTSEKKASPTQCELPTRETERVNRIFKHFSELYHYLWDSQFKSPVMAKSIRKTWVKATMPFDDKSLKRALDVCVTKFMKPPTLPEFIKECRWGNSHASHKAYVPNALPSPKEHSVGEKHLAELRGILKGTRQKSNKETSK